VDFYVLASGGARERARLACRLIERAFEEGQRVLVWLTDAAELASFDELLWTFADRSFVPHEPYGDAAQWRETPVLLSCPASPAPVAPDAPSSPGWLLVNLSTEVPPLAAAPVRIIEVIDSDPARLQSGRHRFRHYRERGLNLQTHHIAGDETG
jgi:DNA polymerase-3 subunit chi